MESDGAFQEAANADDLRTCEPSSPSAPDDALQQRFNAQATRATLNAERLGTDADASARSASRTRSSTSPRG
jgi:hypothetical protein